MNSHPLPPLPTDEDLDEESEEFRVGGRKGHACDKLEQIWHHQTSTARYKEYGSASTKRLLPIVPSFQFMDPQHASQSKKYIQPESLRRTVTSKNIKFSSTLPRPPNTRLRSSIRTPLRGTTVEQHARFLSSTELYTCQNYSAELYNNTRPYRRTQPMDANLKHMFGQRPARSERPLPPLHIIPYRPNVAGTYELVRDYVSLQNPLLSMYPSSTNELRPGARLPPWGSLEDLELQRRDRTEVRAHVQSARNRALRDGMVAGSVPYTLHGQHSTDDLRRDAICKRQEVEHIREEILGVYPDMTFDGTAGKGGRGCCFCCIVM